MRAGDVFYHSFHEKWYMCYRTEDDVLEAIGLHSCEDGGFADTESWINDNTAGFMSLHGNILELFSLYEEKLNELLKEK